MNEASLELLSLLDIEQLELNLFRGIGTGGETSTRIFGGHVIAQALAAAYQTVEERTCHSLHAYFVRPGNPVVPVVYQVDRTRDGNSFTTRRILAIQNGKQILTKSFKYSPACPLIAFLFLTENKAETGLRTALIANLLYKKC